MLISALSLSLSNHPRAIEALFRRDFSTGPILSGQESRDARKIRTASQPLYLLRYFALVIVTVVDRDGPDFLQ